MKINRENLDSKSIKAKDIPMGAVWHHAHSPGDVWMRVRETSCLFKGEYQLNQIISVNLENGSMGTTSPNTPDVIVLSDSELIL